MIDSRKYVDFKVDKEKWNVYSLEDGTKLKTRSILVSVWYINDNGRKKYSCNVRNVNVILCDPKMQGEGNSEVHSTQKMTKNIEEDSCMYNTSMYETSEYTLEDGTIVDIHSNLLRISRTSLFDTSGDRIYLYDLEMSITSIPKIIKSSVYG